MNLAAKISVVVASGFIAALFAIAIGQRFAEPHTLPEPLPTVTELDRCHAALEAYVPTLDRCMAVLEEALSFAKTCTVKK